MKRLMVLCLAIALGAVLLPATALGIERVVVCHEVQHPSEVLWDRLKHLVEQGHSNRYLERLEQRALSHADDPDEWRRLRLRPRVADFHLSRHADDGVPGGPVPGMPGFVFDDNCEPVEQEPEGPEVEETVGSAGGELATSDGSAAVVIPGGALGGDTIISIDPTDDTIPAELGTAASTVFDFGPDGTVFNKMVDVTLAYFPGTDTSDLTMIYEEGGVWRSTPTTINGDGTATGLARHFTRIALLTPQPLGPGVTAVDPSSAAAGTTFTIETDEFFNAGESVEVVILHPDFAFTVIAASADAAGIVSVDFDSTGYDTGEYYAWVESTERPRNTPLQSFDLLEVVLMDTTNVPTATTVWGDQFVQRIAQSVSGTAWDGTMTATFELARSVDLPSDGVVIRLYADDGGVPDESALLATSNVVPATDVPSNAVGFMTVTFTLDVELEAETYWLVIDRTGAVSGAELYLALYGNNDPDPAQRVLYFDGSSWIEVFDADMITKVTVS